MTYYTKGIECIRISFCLTIISLEVSVIHLNQRPQKQGSKQYLLRVLSQAHIPARFRQV